MSVELIILFLATVSDRESDDAALAGKIRLGDHTAFRAFFERYHSQMLGFLRRRGVGEAVALDIIQQAFVLIWEKRASIDPGKSLRAYLFRIGLTRSLNYFRDNEKFISADAFFTSEGGSTGVPAVYVSGGDELHQTTETPEQSTSYHEVQQSLHQAIKKLPEKRREVFELCFVNEFTYREAAETLEISIKTVENQMGAALKEIRSEMKKYLD